MKIEIESTDMITEVAGVQCRVWRGTTERGIACDLAIPLLRVRSKDDQAEFESELKTMPPPTSALVVSMRQIW